MNLFEKIDKLRDNDNYKLGLKYEFGMDTKKNYDRALEYYRLAAKEGHFQAKEKVKNSRINRKSVIFNFFFFIIIMVISLIINELWLAPLATGTSLCTTSVYFFGKYWHRKSFAYRFNLVTFFFSVLVILPLSAVLPYVFGLTTLPVTFLFVIAVFVMLSGIILFISEKEINYVITSVSGLFLLVVSIVTFNIHTPDTIFNFKEVDGGVMITGFKTEKRIVTEIPTKLNNRPVVSIGPYAFANSRVKTMKIPDSVKKIGQYAFYNSLLESIELPDHVELSEGAFAFTKIRSISLPNQLTEIPDNLFLGNYELTEVVIPDTVIRIGKRAFAGVQGMSKIEIPDSVREIDNEAFSYTYLESFHMPNSVEKLGTGVFKNAPLLSDIRFSTQLDKIPDETFYGNQALIQFEVPKHIKIIGKRAFAYSNLERIDFHDDIHTIDEEAFRDNQRLKSVILPKSLTHLNDGLFRNNQSLTYIEIPDSVTSIGNAVFMDNVNLETIELPSNLKSLGGRVFENMVNLKEIRLPSTLEIIGGRAFFNNRSLTKIELPDGIKHLPDELFFGANQLAHVRFPSQLESIGKSVFQDNPVLSEVILPVTVHTIQDNAFYNTINLKFVDLGKGVKYIGAHAFYNSYLETISSLKDVEYIGDLAFAYNLNLKEIELSDRIQYVGHYAFAGCTNLEITIIGASIPKSWSIKWNPDDVPVWFLSQSDGKFANINE